MNISSKFLILFLEKIEELEKSSNNGKRIVVEYDKNKDDFLLFMEKTPTTFDRNLTTTKDHTGISIAVSSEESSICSEVSENLLADDETIVLPTTPEVEIRPTRMTRSATKKQEAARNKKDAPNVSKSRICNNHH